MSDGQKFQFGEGHAEVRDESVKAHGGGGGDLAINAGEDSAIQVSK
jgi:hypothetical protein